MFPNNKPWLNKAVKDAQSKDGIGAKNRVRYETKVAKLQYKSKIEEKFHSDELKAEWAATKA